MFLDIKALHVSLWNNRISYITGRLEDQELETLKALGRGQMFSLPCTTLKYNYKGLSIFMRCD